MDNINPPADTPPRLDDEQLLDLRCWKLLRHLNRHTQAEAAKLMGISRSTLTKLEDEKNTDRILDATHWHRYLSALGKPDYVRKRLHELVKEYDALSPNPEDEEIEESRVAIPRESLVTFDRLLDTVLSGLDGLRDGLAGTRRGFWTPPQQR